MNNFSDKDVLFDLLFTEKALTDVYNMGISESSGNLRSTLIDLWNSVHNLQTNIFNVLHQHGDYKTPPADMQKIGETKNKYCHCCE